MEPPRVWRTFAPSGTSSYETLIGILSSFFWLVSAPIRDVRVSSRSGPAFGERSQGRIDDGLVAGTSAEVARDGLANFSLAGLWLLLEQSLKRQHHPRRAEAALKRVMAAKAFLQSREARTETGAFYGRDSRPFGLDREHQAAANGLPVVEHGTGAADSVLAAQVSAGQVKFVA